MCYRVFERLMSIPHVTVLSFRSCSTCKPLALAYLSQRGQVGYQILVVARIQRSIADCMGVGCEQAAQPCGGSARALAVEDRSDHTNGDAANGVALGAALHLVDGEPGARVAARPDPCMRLLLAATAQEERQSEGRQTKEY